MSAAQAAAALGARHFMRELGPTLERLEGDAVPADLLRDWDTPTDVER